MCLEDEGHETCHRVCQGLFVVRHCRHETKFQRSLKGRDLLTPDSGIRVGNKTRYPREVREKWVFRERVTSIYTKEIRFCVGV